MNVIGFIRAAPDMPPEEQIAAIERWGPVKEIIGERERLLDMMRRRLVSTIVTPRLDRLGISMQEVTEVLGLVYLHGTVRLVSLCEGLDSRTPVGKLAIAAWTALGTMAVPIATPVVKRRQASGPPPYGWFDRRKIEPNPQEQEIIVLIRHLRGLGHRQKGIAEHLNSFGYRTRKGKPWVPQYIDRIGGFADERKDLQRLRAPV